MDDDVYDVDDVDGVDLSKSPGEWGSSAHGTGGSPECSISPRQVDTHTAVLPHEGSDFSLLLLLLCRLRSHRQMAVATSRPSRHPAMVGLGMCPAVLGRCQDGFDSAVMIADV